MEMFKMVGGHLFINHHGWALFSLLNPTKTTYGDPSNWVYDDDIDVDTNEDHPHP